SPWVEMDLGLLHVYELTGPCDDQSCHYRQRLGNTKPHIGDVYEVRRTASVRLGEASHEQLDPGFLPKTCFHSPRQSQFCQVTGQSCPLATPLGLPPSDHARHVAVEGTAELLRCSNSGCWIVSLGAAAPGRHVDDVLDAGASELD